MLAPVRPRSGTAACLAAVVVLAPLGCDRGGEAEAPKKTRTAPPPKLAPETAPAKTAPAVPPMPRDMIPMPPPMPGRSARPKYVVPRLLFVVPHSEALAAREGERTRVEAVRDFVNASTRRLMDYYDVGLVQTGHRAGEGCGFVETTTASGFKVRDPIRTALGLARPVAKKVSIAAALDEIRRHELSKDGLTQVVVVASGGDTCGADACAAAKKLEAESKDLKVHVVAYGAGRRSAKKLECIANATGGRVVRAEDAAALSSILDVALGEQVCPPMAMPCWEQGLKNPREEVRRLVVEHCCALESPVAFRCPYRAMNDEVEALRIAAFSCILGKRWSRKEEALAKALEDQSLKMRAMAIGDLEKHPPNHRLEKVLLRAVQDKDEPLRIRAVRVAAKTVAPWTKGPLAKALEDKDPDVRVAAVEALRGRTDGVAFDVLGTAAKDESARVRRSAVLVLAESKDERALPGLAELAKDTKTKLEAPGKGTVGAYAAKAAAKIEAARAATGGSGPPTRARHP